MSAPLEPDEIITADGVRVQLRPGPWPGARRGRPSTSGLLLALAAAPVVVPVAAAGAAALVGLGMAAASAGLARSVLGALAPTAGPGSAGPGQVHVTVIVVEQWWGGR